MKYKVLDTNILLLDAHNLTALSDPNSIIVLPETVLDEVDTKKTGFEDINFQAREVGRLLAKATRGTIIDGTALTIVPLLLDGVTIYIATVHQYPSFETTASSIINDRKIIHVATILASQSNDVTFITNDTMCGIRAESLGLKVQDVKYVESLDVEFTVKLDLPIDLFNQVHNKPIDIVYPNHQPENFCYVFNSPDLGYQKYATIQNGLVKVIGKETEAELARQYLPPLNADQRFMSYLIQDLSTDVTIVESRAGSGKTATAISNAMRLVGTNTPYEGIVYIRNTVDDLGSPDEAIGFLSGNAEKMEVYLHPFFDTLRSIAYSKLRGKYKGPELEEQVDIQIQSLMAKYNMSAIPTLGLRGRTIDNSIVILDEAQNFSKATMLKVLSRIGKNCKVIVLGSLRQIDSKFVSKYTSGLSVLLAATKRTDLPIKLNAVTLERVVRGPITEFSELIFEKV